MSRATIRISSENGRQNTGGLPGAFGATAPSGTDTVEVDIEVDEATDLEVSSIAIGAARAFDIAFNEQPLEGIIECDIVDDGEFGPETESELDKPEEGETPESVTQQREPKHGDCWALTFDDGSGGLYIFDGKKFQHPEAEPAFDHPARFATSYLPGDSIIVSAVLVGDADVYDTASRDDRTADDDDNEDL